jgi:hypothetical protein
VNSNFIWIWALRRLSLVRTLVLIVSAFLFESSTIKLLEIFYSLYAFAFVFAFVCVSAFVFVCLSLFLALQVSYVC